MRFRTVVGQAAAVNGRRTDQADGILVDERASRFAKGRGRGNLYVLVEVAGQTFAQDALAGQLAEVVRDIYYSQKGSVTASLQRAIYEVNSLLVEENRQSMPEEHRTAGISCAVLRNEDLFLAQAGPAAAYLAHQAQVTRFPESSPWLEGVAPVDVDAAPLGRRHDTRVDLYHVRVTDGDRLLLLNSGTACHLPPPSWSQILAGSPIENVFDDLLAVDEVGELSALVVTFGGEQAKGRPARSAVPSQIRVRAPRSASAAVPASQRVVRAKPVPRKRTMRRALAAFSAWLVSFLKRLVPSQPPAPQSPRRQMAAVSTVQERKDKEQARITTRPRRRGERLQRVLMVTAIAIPFAVAGFVAYTVLQRDKERNAVVDQLWLNAQTHWVQAQATSDPAAVRDMLARADESLVQLLARQPDHADALELREKIRARLEETSQVRRVLWEGVLATYPAEADLTRVVVEGVHVFVLDRNADRVYHHQLDEFQQALKPETLETVLVRKGDRVGNILVGDFVDLVWMPVGNGRQKASLVILESGGALLEYDPVTDELVPLRVAGSENWILPDQVGSHSGRFYLLDAGANKIWRYGPTAEGYTSPPLDWLTAAVDLVGVTDMAVGDSIFLLYADGRIQKLSAGGQDTFDISDWDRPPQGASALFTRPPNDTQWVYVADRGNSRIVQSDKEGHFKRQFRLADSGQGQDSDPLGGVTSLFVDEIGGRAYFLSGNQLYIMIVPD